MAIGSVEADESRRLFVVCGGWGSSSPQGRTVVRKECLSDTDEPSLESRVAVNVMAAAWLIG